MVESPVKVRARENGIPLLEISDVNTEASLDVFRETEADIFVVVSFGQKLPSSLLALAPAGGVNLHPSLLPKYRGASPIAGALLKGEKETGVTVHKIIEKMDAGDILLQEKLELEGDENAAQVYERLADLGAHCVVRALDLMDEGKIQPRKQNDSEASLTMKLCKEDSWIDWGASAEGIHNHVRAFYMWPGSKTMMGQKELTILKTKKCSEETPSGHPPGTVISVDDREGIQVATGKGCLWIQQLKLEGKRSLSHKDFLNGHPLESGFVFRRRS